LKRYEWESFLKSFLLFFILILSLYLLVVWQHYQEQRHQLDSEIYHEMKLFSYDPRSDAFDVSFVPTEKSREPVAYFSQGASEIHALFTIPNSKSYLLKVSLPKERYDQRLTLLRQKIYAGVYWYGVLILLLAALLAYYTMYPLRKALRLNEEFVKDILHDINTPLSSLLINLKILKKRFGEDRGFDRMQHSVQTIEGLQSDLRSFLHGRPDTKERITLHMLLRERIEYFRILYPQVHFSMDVDEQIQIESNKEAFVRVVDNLLSNAGKYNKKEGEVHLVLQGDLLSIEDTGIGIRDTRKAFERYYKEGERGMGLGLHIVQKLIKEMDIDIELQSVEGEGTRITLDLSQVIMR